MWCGGGRLEGEMEITGARTFICAIASSNQLIVNGGWYFYQALNHGTAGTYSV